MRTYRVDMTKWVNRDRKKLKKRKARRIDNQYKERGQGKDSNKEKREDQFRKNLADLRDDLAEILGD